MDTKVLLLVGEYSNAGKEFQAKGTPAWSKIHDFIYPEMGKAIKLLDEGYWKGWLTDVAWEAGSRSKRR